MQLFLRAPLLTLEIRKKMGVCNVRFVGRVVQSFVEHTLKLVYERLLSTHEPGKPFHIVGNIESIVPGTTFVKSGVRLKVLSLPRVERSIEFTVRQDRTESTVLLTVIMLVAQRTFVEQTGILLLAKRSGYARQSIVGNIVFQGMRNGIVILLPQGHISQ